MTDEHKTNNSLPLDAYGEFDSLFAQMIALANAEAQDENTRTAAGIGQILGKPFEHSLDKPFEKLANGLTRSHVVQELERWLADPLNANHPQRPAAQILQKVYANPKYVGLQRRLLPHLGFNGTNPNELNFGQAAQQIGKLHTPTLPASKMPIVNMVNSWLERGMGVDGPLAAQINSVSRPIEWTNFGLGGAPVTSNVYKPGFYPTKFASVPMTLGEYMAQVGRGMDFTDHQNPEDVGPRIQVKDVAGFEAEIDQIGKQFLAKERNNVNAQKFVKFLTTLGLSIKAGALVGGVALLGGVAHDYQQPSSQQLHQSQPAPGDVFQTDTTVDPDSDPTVTMQKQYQNSKWTVPSAAPGVGAPAGAQAPDPNAAPSPATSDDGAAPLRINAPMQTPQVWFPSDSVSQELGRRGGSAEGEVVTAQAAPAAPTTDPSQPSAPSPSQPQGLESVVNQPAPTFAEVVAQMLLILNQNGGPNNPAAQQKALAYVQQQAQKALQYKADVERALGANSPQGAPLAAPPSGPQAAPQAAPGAQVQASALQGALTDILMRRATRTTLASGVDEAVSTLTDQLQNVTQNGKTDAQGNNVMDSQLSAEMGQAQQDQDNASATVEQGGGRNDQEAMVQALATNVPMAKPDAQTYYQAILAGSVTAGTTVDQVYPVAYALARRSRGNVQRCTAILQTLCEFEGKAPGIGVFPVAIAASEGKPIAQQMMMLKMSLTGLTDTSPQDMSALQVALIGCGMPNSDLKALLDWRNKSRIQVRNEEYDLTMKVQNWLMNFNNARDQAELKVYHYLESKLPGLMDSAFVKGLVQALSVYAASQDIKQGVLNAGSFGGAPGTFNNMSQKPQGLTLDPTTGTFTGKHASSKFRRVATAQAVPPTGGQNGGYNPNAPYVVPNPGAAGQPQPAQPAPNGMPSPSGTPMMQGMSGTMQAIQNGTNQSMAAPGTPGAAGTPGQGGQGQYPNWVNQLGYYDKAVYQEFTAVTDAQQNLDTITQQGGVLESLYASLETNVGARDTTKGGTPGMSSVANATGPQLTAMANQMVTVCDTASQIVTQQGMPAMASLMKRLQQAQAMGIRPTVMESIGIQGYNAKFQAALNKLNGYREYAFDMSVAAPILQGVTPLEFKREEALRGIGASPNGLGTKASVEKYARASYDVASMYDQIALAFQSKAQSDPTMQKHCQQKVEVYQGLAKEARGQGLAKYRQMLGATAGVGVAGYGSSSITMPGDRAARDMNTLLARHGMPLIPVEDIRVADKELEDYYNDLYKGTPGSPEFGTALEDAPEDAGVPTTEIGAPKRRHHLKFKKKVDLSE